MPPERQQQPHHTVEQLTIAGGFLDGARFELVDGLNCFIGGRGAGKTTALELLRFVLDLMPDARESALRHRTLDGLVKANLGGGRVTAALRTKMGMSYTASRAYAQDVQVRNEAGEIVPISLDRDQIFGADVFSQNQIEEIAASPSAQLALLDRFVQAETTAADQELADLLRQLKQTSSDLIRLDAEIETVRAQASELPVVQEKLKGFEQLAGTAAANIPNHALKQQRQRESTIVDHLLSAARSAVGGIEAAAIAFGGTLSAELDKSGMTGVNADAITAIEKEARVFHGALETAAAAAAAAARTLYSSVPAAGAMLAARHVEQEAEYLRLVGELKEHGGRLAERDALQKHLASALAASTNAQAKAAQRQTVLEKRKHLLALASESRDRRFHTRKRVADELTRAFDGGIRVTIEQGGDCELYKTTLAEMLRGAGLQQGPTAEKLTQHLVPTELARAVLEANLVTIADAGLDEKRAPRVVAALLAEGRVYEIELAELVDLPRIELRDGAVYKDSTQLSTGQRCTTILPIILLQSERPLLVDQPEDNLDNAFIYDTVVKSLRSAKGRRQIIFVTHNPNIPVLGEADKIFVLHSDGQCSSVRHVGTVDECKGSIESILEGGRDAFLKRKARYGH